MALAGVFRAAHARAIEDMQFFPEVPVLYALRSTWEGNLWVQRRGEEPDVDLGPIDVLTPDGRYLGTLDRRMRMPHGFGPNGLVVFIEKDEFDVPVIVVNRGAARSPLSPQATRRPLFPLLVSSRHSSRPKAQFVRHIPAKDGGQTDLHRHPEGLLRSSRLSAPGGGIGHPTADDSFQPRFRQAEGRARHRRCLSGDVAQEPAHAAARPIDQKH